MIRTTLALLVLASPAFADAHVGPRVTGDIQNAAGEIIGSVSVFETASGIVRVNVQATEVEPGAHGVHLHEVGECTGDFSSAGGHIAGDANHGLVEGGPHPGDLPNAFVTEEGVLQMEAFNSRISVEEHLEDADGAALIIHAGADDYESQPGGESGDRVACAVLNNQPM
ncbi:superoxide dismutase family protein [Jannaschia sp. W003]|uniref:superoxide dismutase family protein n=1 Tax=Jannaschia sp. W003 TaxID=2867012 RepID=UPI0021A501DA|nr:superoxide dismutase family protein [Jannaschia sp. W003]UWQ20908.1 superoxide dismutase family protein [Jannaschia sp. W003]